MISPFLLAQNVSVFSDFFHIISNEVDKILFNAEISQWYLEILIDMVQFGLHCN